MNKYLAQLVRQSQQNLIKNEEALAYLKERNVSLSQIQEFELGYIPEDKWPPYIDASKATTEEIDYLDKTYKGARLKGKLIFPMSNALGIYSGFQIRSPKKDVKDYWKYYSPRSGIDALFFGTKQAMKHVWETEEVYLVEGLFDLFPVQRKFPNVLCTGTANVSEDQMTFLSRYVKVINVMFDNDEQGERFFETLYKNHKEDFLQINKIPYLGKDPSDSYQRLGSQKFYSQIKTGMNLNLNCYSSSFGK